MMKSRVFYFLILWVAGFIVSCKHSHTSSLTLSKNEWQSIRKKLVPDARDHVFDIDYKILGDSLILTGATDVDSVPSYLQRLFSGKGWKVKENIRLLPLPEWKNKVGVVRLSVANLRTVPKHSAELASQMLMGMPVRILEYKNGFYHIRTTEGYLGWTDTAALKIMDKKAFSQWASATKIIIGEPCSAVYRDTLPDATSVSDLVINDVLELVSDGSGFFSVRLPDGRKGYVPQRDCVELKEWETLNSQFADVNNVVDLAVKRFQGIPYLWGGTSSKALDCSGFTKTLYQYFGLLLPRDASQQFHYGKLVSLENNLKQLMPGDLLFFGTHKTRGSPKVTHVALYIGNGRIIHATGEVKIESLWPSDSLYNDARRKTLLGARRIWGNYNRRIYPFYTQEAVKIFFRD